MASMIRRTETIFLIDDEPAVLKSVSRVLRAAGFRTAEYESAARFLAEHDATVPGCAVIDLSMPSLDGLSLQRALAGRDHVARPIVFLSARADVASSVRAMKDGAVDFLTKPVDDAVLIEAVLRALERDREERDRTQELALARARFATLTPREREVLGYIVAGRLNKQVAAALGTAEKTIKVHRARVMEKMGADSLAELVREAHRLGITGS